MSKPARIRFQYPGWDMAWWTGLFILFAAVGVWVSVTIGKTSWYLVAAMGLSIPAIGVWFRVRMAGHTFVVVNTFFGILGIAGLFVLPFHWRTILRIAMSFSTAYSALEWTRRILIENELLDEGLCWDDVKELMKDQERFPD
jgi:hypothetical protein